jgi:two-component system chemotaxis sensor kinase CheA
MTEIDHEFIDLFREEASERLERIVAILLAVEAGTPPADATDALFREFHTIKGGAGMVGLDTVRDVAHAVEDILADLRESDAGGVPPTLAPMLFALVDSLRQQIERPAKGEASDLLAVLETSRQGLLSSDPSPGAPEPEPEPDPLRRRGRAIRIPPEKLDRVLDLVGEAVLHRRRLEHTIEDDALPVTRELADELAHGERLLDELHETALGMRTLSISSITAPYARAVRDLAVEQGKDVELVVSGGATEIDRVILDGLSEPLVHLLRNAVTHGVELPEVREQAGKPRRALVELIAEQRGALVSIVIADDGRGVPPSALRAAEETGSLTAVLAQPGFSTAATVTDAAGRGVGLDAVERHVEAFGGSFEVTSEPGQGTRVAMLLPLTLAVLDVLLIERGGRAFALPLPSVLEAVRVSDVLSLEGRPALDIRGETVGLVDVADVLGATAAPPPNEAPAVVISSGGARLAIACDRLLGDEEVVVKSLGPLLAGVTGYLGAALLGDGRVALILDPAALARSRGRRVEAPAVASEPVAPKVLVVEDSLTVRELQRGILEAAGYRVETANDGRDGLERVLGDDDVDLVVTDVEMPELDGIELVRAIRATPGRGELPIVIVSSRGTDDDRRRGLEAGADAYVVKESFDQQALLDTVARLIGP